MTILKLKGYTIIQITTYHIFKNDAIKDSDIICIADGFKEAIDWVNKVTEKKE